MCRVSYLLAKNPWRAIQQRSSSSSSSPSFFLFLCVIIQVETGKEGGREGGNNARVSFVVAARHPFVCVCVCACVWSWGGLHAETTTIGPMRRQTPPLSPLRRLLLLLLLKQSLHHITSYRMCVCVCVFFCSPVSFFSYTTTWHWRMRFGEHTYGAPRAQKPPLCLSDQTKRPFLLLFLLLLLLGWCWCSIGYWWWRERGEGRGGRRRRRRRPLETRWKTKRDLSRYLL